MKKEVRLALLCLAATSAPAFAQNPGPACGAANFDQSRSVFTVMNPVANAVNQQCFLTVYAKGTAPEQARQHPALYPTEGRYIIELSGGGGGGGGGATNDQGGGGGGAGAAPSRTTQYLAPGVYRLTLGTGGRGGLPDGGRTAAGNPTSLTHATSGALIAGFAGADLWQQRSRAANDGQGGIGKPGGSTGGSGGDSGAIPEQGAQSGGQSATPGYSGVAGASGSESGRAAQTPTGLAVQSNAGGGGGASVGSGGTGDSATRNATAGAGDLGGGGGGGRGGANTADSGGQGGHGFIRLTPTEPAPAEPVAVATPAPVIVVMPTTQRYSLSSDTLFGFGQSTLKPSGQAQLNELVGKLRQTTITSMTYTGHADRIGASERNQQLSLNRAESVQNYLIGQGVRAERSVVAGRGETQPVTGNDACQGAASAKVIACLQPDRRVEIEVVGRQK